MVAAVTGGDRSSPRPPRQRTRRGESCSRFPPETLIYEQPKRRHRPSPDYRNPDLWAPRGWNDEGVVVEVAAAGKKKKKCNLYLTGADPLGAPERIGNAEPCHGLEVRDFRNNKDGNSPLVATSP